MKFIVHVAIPQKTPRKVKLCEHVEFQIIVVMLCNTQLCTTQQFYETPYKYKLMSSN